MTRGVSVTGVTGGVLGLLPFLGPVGELLTGVESDLGDEGWTYIVALTCANILAVIVAVGPLWLRPPILVLVGVGAGLVAIAADSYFAPFVIPAAALLAIGSVTSAVEITRLWDK